MTDFEIQRRLRELNAPREPQVDLWPDIATRIESTAAMPTARRWNRLPLAAAAALLMTVVTGTIVIGVRQHQAEDSAVAANLASPLAKRALERAPGGDPRLASAAIVLDTAHAELQQALEQRPDAVFLVSLLNRTNARRMKLEQFGASAG